MNGLVDPVAILFVCDAKAAILLHLLNQLILRHPALWELSAHALNQVRQRSAGCEVANIERTDKRAAAQYVALNSSVPTGLLAGLHETRTARVLQRECGK